MFYENIVVAVTMQYDTAQLIYRKPIEILSKMHKTSSLHFDISRNFLLTLIE